jgi:hypothetical protein
MTVIELPDDQVAALTAKAAADGMMLKDWLGKLATAEAPSAINTERLDEEQLDARPISEVIAEIMKDVPPEAFAQLPKDGASQVDHYVYGLPKRY